MTQATRYYEITDQGGRLAIEDRWIETLLRRKQRAVASSDWMLGAFPPGSAEGQWNLILAHDRKHAYWNARSADILDEAPPSTRS